MTRVACLSSVVLSILYWTVKYTPVLRITQASGAAESGANVPFLTIVPDSPLYLLWTVLTASFVSSNIVSLVASLATIFFGGKYLERVTSSREFAKLLMVTVLIPNTILLSTVLALSGLTQQESWLHLSIFGATAVQAGIIVAFKQQIPEHTVSIYKSPAKIRVRHLPILFVLATVLSIPVLGYIQMLQALLGFFSSWIYLRFYKTSSPDLGAPMMSLRGDASETFALSQFFPEALQPSVDRIANLGYDVFLSVGILKPFSSVFEESNELGRRSAGPVVGRAEAERRRTVALKALDIHLTRDVPVAISELPPQVGH